MTNRTSLSRQLYSFFLILVLSIIIMTGLSSYLSQAKRYKTQNEQNLENIVTYLGNMMSADGEEFIAYQQIMLAHGDKIRIPLSYDGNYHPAKIAFYEKYNSTYPGKSLGTDVDYLKMPEELQILYGTYKHEYWLHVFSQVKHNFGIAYVYYITPTGEPFHMYYMIDAIPEPYIINDQEFMTLNLDIKEPEELYPHMWDTWTAGREVDGYDIFNNEYGHTYANYYPLWVNGQKMGLVCADMEVKKVNTTILNDTVYMIIIMALLSIVFAAVLSLMLQKKYISRLVQLKRDIQSFTDHKDSSLAVTITHDIKGSDEISDLAQQVSTMIIEIGDYMNTLIEKNEALTEAQEKIRKANELAHKDALTGVRNKTAYDAAEASIEYKIHSERYKDFGIVMVDLNCLKYINDHYGHDKGNLAIMKICETVCKVFSHSPVFRVGGDEFVVILQNEDYKQCPQRIYEFKECMKNLSADTSLEPWERVSAAIGWAIFDPETDNGVEVVLRRADDLMYKNKKEMKAGGM